MRYEITTEPDGVKHRGDSLAQLAQHLGSVEHHPYSQVWIYQEDGQALGVFFNRSFASVDWVTEDGNSADAYNPNYSGPEDAVQEFYIENGQLDEYRTRNCISKQEGRDALLFFFEHGRKPEWLHWRD